MSLNFLNAFLCFTLLVRPAGAILLAHYDFTDGDLTDNEVGPAETLTLVNQGDNLLTISPEGAAVFPGETDADRDYLEVERGLGAPAFTVSFWFKTDTVDQGGFQGLFSNNIINSPDNFSWQVDVHDGVLRLVSATTGFPGITNAGPEQPQIEAGVWHHVVVRKLAGNNAELWLGSEDSPLEMLGSVAVNPGGLQWFRLGVNRNSDSLYAMEMANVKIYDDIEVSLSDLHAEGPRLITGPPTPVALDLVIRPSVTSAGLFDFTWNGREGKVYDLVSSSELSGDLSGWLVWDGRAGITGTTAPVTLSEVPGGGQNRRFFAVIERDP